MRKTVYAFQQLAEENLQLYIYDDITKYGDFNWETLEFDDSETSAKYFRDQLNANPDANVDLFINSAGGDVMEANAIYALLGRHHGKITAYVDGMCYSAAALILMAADRRVMAAGTTMLVHNAWMNVSGNAEQLRKAADDLDALMASNRQVFLDRSGKITEQELIDLMAEERILTPSEALQFGFIDEITTAMPEKDNDPANMAAQQAAAIENRIEQLIDIERAAKQLHELALSQQKQVEDQHEPEAQEQKIPEEPARQTMMQVLAEALRRSVSK